MLAGGLALNKVLRPNHTSEGWAQQRARERIGVSEHGQHQCEQKDGRKCKRRGTSVREQRSDIGSASEEEQQCE